MWKSAKRFGYAARDAKVHGRPLANRRNSVTGKAVTNLDLATKRCDFNVEIQQTLASSNSNNKEWAGMGRDDKNGNMQGQGKIGEKNTWKGNEQNRRTETICGVMATSYLYKPDGAHT